MGKNAMTGALPLRRDSNQSKAFGIPGKIMVVRVKMNVYHFINRDVRLHHCLSVKRLAVSG